VLIGWFEIVAQQAFECVFHVCEAHLQHMVPLEEDLRGHEDADYAGVEDTEEQAVLAEDNGAVALRNNLR
jgi:hypothetical protein